MGVDTKNAGNKVAINTIVLYVKFFFTALFSLFTVRFLIDSLGVENYGIYTLVAGVITLLTFINSAMTVATQRYLSFHQGVNDLVMQKKIFKNSILLHLCIAIFLAFILFLIKSFLFDGFLNIANDKINMAIILYYGMIVSVFFTIISVPFNAILVSNENLFTDSLILIFKSIFMLLISIMIGFFPDLYRLGIFGALIGLLNVFVFIFYVFYCFKKYQECTFRSELDFSVLKELAVFALWNLYTNLCYVLNTQGINVLINKFYGTNMNAAYGIAFQVNSQIKNLSQSLLSAINPQIMKSEGMSNRERTLKTSVIASKFGFFLVSIAAVPCFYIMPDLVKLWLGVVPDDVVMFCLYFLIVTLINQLTIGITPAVQAVGKIKKFQISIGTTALTLLPLSYLFLSNNYFVESVFFIMIFIEIVTGILKIFIYSDIFKVTFFWYFEKVIFKSIFPFLLVNILLYFIFIRTLAISNFILILLLSTSIYIPLFYIFSLNDNERSHIIRFCNIIISKCKNKLLTANI